MVDTILSKAASLPSAQMPGTTARLKVSSPSLASLPTGLSNGEQQLADLVGIGADARDQARKTRKLDAFLQVFRSVLTMFNGAGPQRYVPQFSKVEVELVPPKNPVKIDV